MEKTKKIGLLNVTVLEGVKILCMPIGPSCTSYLHLTHTPNPRCFI